MLVIYVAEIYNDEYSLGGFMMTFRPHTDSHAVSSAAFAIYYGADLPAEKLARQAFPKLLPWDDELPGHREVRGTTLQIDFGTSEARNLVNGIEFLRYQPDGTPAVLLRISTDHIAVQTNVYTRWGPVWKHTERLLRQALQVLEGLVGAPSVTRCEFRVIDRFYTDGAEYEASGLLVSAAEIPQIIFGAGPAWHAHTGWFSNQQCGRTLENLNIDALPNPIVDDIQNASGWQIAILHFQRSWFEPALDHSIEHTMEKLVLTANCLHQSNKALLNRILTPEIKVAIKLNGQSQ